MVNNNSFFLMLSLLVISACAENKAGSVSTVSNSDTQALADHKVDTTASPQLILVERSNGFLTGKAFYTVPYCGGARPTDEIMEEAARLRKLKNTKIRFTSAIHESEVHISTTDAQGGFIADLKPGKWDYYLTKDVDPALGLDLKCEKWFSRNYGSITVTENKKDGYEIILHLSCDPCDPSIKLRQ